MGFVGSDEYERQKADFIAKGKVTVCPAMTFSEGAWETEHWKAPKRRESEKRANARRKKFERADVKAGKPKPVRKDRPLALTPKQRRDRYYQRLRETYGDDTELREMCKTMTRPEIAAARGWSLSKFKDIAYVLGLSTSASNRRASDAMIARRAAVEEMVARGVKQADIADQLGVSIFTIENDLRVLRKRPGGSWESVGEVARRIVEKARP